MNEPTSTVSRKGQVTVPAEIRKALGIKEGDKVSFVLEGNGAKLQRRGSVVKRTAGLFKTDQPALSAEELRAIVEQAFADEALERSGG